jgi:hypothetical protein
LREQPVRLLGHRGRRQGSLDGSDDQERRREVDVATDWSCLTIPTFQTAVAASRVLLDELQSGDYRPWIDALWLVGLLIGIHRIFGGTAIAIGSGFLRSRFTQPPAG